MIVDLIDLKQISLEIRMLEWMNLDFVLYLLCELKINVKNKMRPWVSLFIKLPGKKPMTLTMTQYLAMVTMHLITTHTLYWHSYSPTKSLLHDGKNAPPPRWITDHVVISIRNVSELQIPPLCSIEFAGPSPTSRSHVLAIAPNHTIGVDV